MTITNKYFRDPKASPNFYLTFLFQRNAKTLKEGPIPVACPSGDICITIEEQIQPGQSCTQYVGKNCTLPCDYGDKSLCLPLMIHSVVMCNIIYCSTTTSTTNTPTTASTLDPHPTPPIPTWSWQTILGVILGSLGCAALIAWLSIKINAYLMTPGKHNFLSVQ